MTYSRICLLLLAFAAGCARSESGSADSAGTTAATPASSSPRSPAEVAAIANAISANPTKADSILTANAYTADEFERVLYAIASDSAQSAAYAAARTP
jgi:hypothetical protein